MHALSLLKSIISQIYIQKKINRNPPQCNRRHVKSMIVCLIMGNWQGKQLRHRTKLSEIMLSLRSYSKESPNIKNAMTKVTGEVGKNIKGKSVTTTNGRHKHAHR